MIFLNPILLWGLPAALLPVLIHLLNRLRFRSVRWAAMIFLISATRSSTKRARLRHYLILLCRVLAILLLILALSRPTVGGWLGGTLAGAPDTIILLLDRSASMEATDPRRQCSKRDYALQLFAQAAETVASSRYVLIESVLRLPHEIATPSVLPELALSAATDTAADIPAMLQAALTYMIENKTGRTELWLASDLQASNWYPQRREWEKLSAQIGALPQDVRIRLLALSDGYGHNVGISLQHAERRRALSSQLGLALDITSVVPRSDTFPMIITLDGTRSQVELSVDAPVLHIHRTMALPPDRVSGGWGKVELPADENPRDNICYFVYGDDVPLRSAVVSDSPLSSRYLRLAAAPTVEELDQACTLLSSRDADALAWQDLALLIWQAPAPSTGTTEAISAFVENGGTVVFFPPAQNAGRSTGVSEGDAVFGAQWGDVDHAAQTKPFRVPTWEAHDGPLADTAGGLSLPLDRLAFQRRQDVTVAEGFGERWTALARFADGKPFLLRHALGAGRAFICTALPHNEWSDLSEGSVLVPMLQRMLQSGGQRLKQAQTADCGDWRPRDSQEAWTSLDTTEHKNPQWEAGVYQHGTRRVALNSPACELLPDAVDSAEVGRLFGDVPIHVLDNLSHGRADKLQSEIWPLFLCLALACLLAESGLLLPSRVQRSRSSRKDLTS